MLFRKWKAQKDLVESTRRDKATEFNRTVNIIEQLRLIKEHEELSTIIGVYDFSIRAIAREIASSSACQLFHGKHCPYSDDYEIKFVKGRQTENIKFGNNQVVSAVWNQGKWLGAVRTVLKEGFRQSEGYYTGYLYKELNLIVIKNGLHHTSIASLINAGSAKVQIIHLSDYFERLTTDGAYWFYNDGAEQKTEEVGDYRIAVLYELARRREAVAGEAKLVLPQDEEIPHELDAMADRLLAAQNEKNYYKQECRLLENKLKQLEAQLQQSRFDAQIPQS